MPSNIVSLSTISRRRPVAPSGCGPGAVGRPDIGGCGSSSSSNTGKPAAAKGVAERVKDHPCYSEEAHHYFARLHLGVAPACNIQCHYCNRKYDCANESRPGVVSERLTPEQALEKALSVAARMPQLSVIGIAGPGDAIYDHRRTFDTCRLVAEYLPDVKLCLSTNGLALPDHVDEITALGIEHVTITINTLDPEIGAQIYPWIFHDGRRRSGPDAAAILRDRQLAGLDALVAAGTLVKVNSVMIPGINDAHLAEVHEEVLRRGAFLHNVMPLISDPAHGTHFGLTGQRGPDPEELEALRASLGGQQMSHCRQCRADAVGLLGEGDGCDTATGEAADAPAPVAETADTRRVYREVVAPEREERARAAAAAAAALAVDGPDEPVLVAVCTRGGGRVNRHFGHATEFPVYAVDRSGVRLVGLRRADRYCQGGGDDDRLNAAVAALSGVSLLLCEKIGPRPRKDLAAAGIAAVDAYPRAFIETAAAAALRDRRSAVRESARPA